MEGQSHMIFHDQNLNNPPDLNYDDDRDGAYGCSESLLGESSLPDEEAHATNEVETSNIVVEELERRLAIGEIVENEHIAHSLYCKYASAKGFSVRKGWTVYFKDGSGLSGKFFLCSCEGKKDVKRSENKVPDYQKMTFRCGCQARLKISRKKGQPWRVTKFQKKHNHELYAIDQTYLLRSSGKLSDDQELLLTTMVKCKIPVSKAFSLLENVAQGRESVGFLQKDAYDYLRKSEKKEIEKGDIFNILKHVKDKSNTESEFYWNLEVDNDDRVVNFFFRDSRCLVDYQHFGDVLSFDTTYQTNRYSLICALFVGINHHNENVLFGIAFMSSETESSFEWLFRVFLESMGGKQPETIFTDQCPAMMNAIQTVFPLSHHRLCQWHINQNYTSQFGNLKSEWGVKGLWKKCMNHCECDEEFESTWKELMERLDIYKVDKEWFDGMYNLRHLWATCFSNEVFCARLHATSRSEGTNAALKSIFGNQTSYLLDCVLGYEKLQDNWRVNEKKNDTLCCHNMPTPVVPHNPLLKQAANVYTFNIFKLFEKELQDTMGFEYPQPFTCEGSTLLFFKVKSYSEGSRFKLVEYDSENLEVKCSCHKFETCGVLCSHILKVFDVLNMHIIPEKYIKKRWTKVARGGVCDEHSTLRSEKSGNGGSYVNEMAFVNNVTKEVHDIAMQGKANVEVRDIIIEGIESIKGRINVLSKKGNLKDSMACDNLVHAEDYTNLDEVVVREPITAKSRGVTNVFKRHWDDKRKKRKGKAEGSKRAAKVVKRSQDSQTLRDCCTSQEATFSQQVQWSQNQMHNQMHFGTRGQ